ncbi:MAG: chemotaxis protein CheW [Cyanobacteria bacterium P01_A01_bin.114]
MHPSQSSAPALAPADRLQQLLPELFEPTSAPGEKFLRLSLAPDLTVALALSWVEESLLISTQLVTPIPNMPPSVLGLMSSKGQVFWAVNLAQLLKLPAVLAPSQSYEVVVIRALPTSSDQMSDDGFLTQDTRRQLFLGLVVPKIRGTVRLSREEIVSPIDEVEANLQPYLSGQVVVDDETILVLSAEAIGAIRSLTPS